MISTKMLRRKHAQFSDIEGIIAKLGKKGFQISYEDLQDGSEPSWIIKAREGNDPAARIEKITKEFIESCIDWYRGDEHWQELMKDEPMPTVGDTSYDIVIPKKSWIGEYMLVVLSWDHNPEMLREIIPLFRYYEYH